MIRSGENPIHRIAWGNDHIEAVYKGTNLIWPEVYLEDRYVQFYFDQTGKPEDAFQGFHNNGLIEYVTENTKSYIGKCMPDGTVTVIPVVVDKNLETGAINHARDEIRYDVPGQPLSEYKANTKIDFLTQIPKIFFSCKEVDEDIFDVKIATYPFVGAHELFGKDRLIGRYSGERQNDKWWSNINVGVRNTFTQVRDAISNKGPGWYGMTSEETGLLLMIGMCLQGGVNGRIITYDFAPFGVANVFCNGTGRIWVPNLVIEPSTDGSDDIATVYHLDGNVEHFRVPYIWNGYFNKLYWGEYLTPLPKSAGPQNSFYTKSQCWIGNHKGIGIYFPEGEGTWSIAGDRDDSDATGLAATLRARCCYYGNYVITHDAEYFESLPIL